MRGGLSRNPPRPRTAADPQWRAIRSDGRRELSRLAPLLPDRSNPHLSKLDPHSIHPHSHRNSHIRSHPPSHRTMSVLSHHFQQQRKSEVQQRNNLKQQQQTLPQTQSSTPAIASVPAPSADSSKDLRALAASARSGTIGWEDLSDAEVLLRRWDMDLKFGPSTGMTRMERWERALAFGLNPPTYIRELLQSMQLDTQDQKPLIKNGSGSHSVFHTTVHGREV